MTRTPTRVLSLTVRLNGVPLRVELASEEVELLRAVLAEREPPALLTTEEAARYLRTTPRGIHDRVHRRGLAAVRDGSRLLFRRSDLDAYLTEAATRARPRCVGVA
jgi:excisionase family DNA binding protein